MMAKILGGRYQLGAMIGTGGMADVYIAQDQRLSREVAVKILRSDLAKDPTFVSRFRKEAKAGAKPHFWNISNWSAHCTRGQRCRHGPWRAFGRGFVGWHFQNGRTPLARAGVAHARPEAAVP